jgi:hypothetical protein
MFGDFFYRFIPIALGIKDTKLRLCLLHTNLHLTIDNEGRLRTKDYDKRCFINVICIYLGTLVSNTISISDDVPVVYH